MDDVIPVSFDEPNDHVRRRTNQTILNLTSDNDHQNGSAGETNKKKKKNWKWNVFTEDGSNQQSVSEKKYDKSLQTKYKLLKVHYLKSKKIL